MRVRPRFHLLGVALLASAAAGCAQAQADDASLRESFAERIADTEGVVGFERNGDEITFTGPDGGGGTASWRITIDTSLVEPDDFNEEMPFVGRVTSQWHKDGELVEWLDTTTALPQFFLDRGLAQECWAYWIAAESRWDW
jgi:hypothetical protein